MTPGWEVLDGCMEAVGSDRFAVPFLALLRGLGADQVMVFSYDEAHAACLLSWNFSHARLGTKLAEDYLDGWYRRDPLYGRVLSAAPGSVALHRLGDRADDMPPDYRQRFFTGPGIGHKDAVLAVGDRLRLILNVYRHAPDAAAPPAEALLFAARLALMHFERAEGAVYPAPLAALSEREREVCLGILAGKKTETIAGEIGVSANTVTTYRRRAYEKLGVSSRAALFAICRD